MFLIADLIDIHNTRSLSIITFVRAFVLFISICIAVWIARYKGESFRCIATLITIYEIISMVAFLVIIREYDSISPLGLLSVLVIIVAVYLIPNKLANVQILTVVFLLVFFLSYSKKIEGLDIHDYQGIALYGIIIMLFGNFNAYITNYFIRKQYVYNKELLRVSATDSLTGIYNRGKFIKEMAGWVKKSHMEKSDLSVILCDVDDFKKVNDTYGHFVGDQVLQNIVSVIKDCISNDDVFARWGGEEFAVLLPNTNLKKAIEIAQLMRAKIELYHHCIAENETHNFSCSFGLVSIEENDNIESMMHKADLLLYKAKNAGKNVVIYNKTKRQEN